MRTFSNTPFKYTLGLFLWLAILAIFLFPARAMAQATQWEAPSSATTAPQVQPAFVLQNFYLSGNETLLTARIGVGISNLDYLRDILRDGARLVVECRSALYRKRSFWTNELVGEYHFSSSLKYNPLQRDYLIFSENGASITNPDLGTLFKATWGNLEMPLAELALLEKEETYLAVVSLTLRHEEMPPWLSKNVFFWSDVIIPKQEYTLEFDY